MTAMVAVPCWMCTYRPLREFNSQDAGSRRYEVVQWQAFNWGGYCWPFSCAFRRLYLGVLVATYGHVSACHMV